MNEEVITTHKNMQSIAFANGMFRSLCNMFYVNRRIKKNNLRISQHSANLLWRR